MRLHPFWRACQFNRCQLSRTTLLVWTIMLSFPSKRLIPSLIGVSQPAHDFSTVMPYENTVSPGTGHFAVTLTVSNRIYYVRISVRVLPWYQTPCRPLISLEHAPSRELKVATVLTNRIIFKTHWHVRNVLYSVCRTYSIKQQCLFSADLFVWPSVWRKCSKFFILFMTLRFPSGQISGNILSRTPFWVLICQSMNGGTSNNKMLFPQILAQCQLLCTGL